MKFNVTLELLLQELKRLPNPSHANFILAWDNFLKSCNEFLQQMVIEWNQKTSQLLNGDEFLLYILNDLPDNQSLLEQVNEKLFFLSLDGIDGKLQYFITVLHMSMQCKLDDMLIDNLFFAMKKWFAHLVSTQENYATKKELYAQKYICLKDLMFTLSQDNTTNDHKKEVLIAKLIQHKPILLCELDKISFTLLEKICKSLGLNNFIVDTYFPTNYSMKLFSLFYNPILRENLNKLTLNVLFKP